jgi:hypothetical protein
VTSVPGQGARAEELQARVIELTYDRDAVTQQLVDVWRERDMALANSRQIIVAENSGSLARETAFRNLLASHPTLHALLWLVVALLAAVELAPTIYPRLSRVANANEDLLLRASERIAETERAISLLREEVARTQPATGRVHLESDSSDVVEEQDLARELDEVDSYLTGARGKVFDLAEARSRRSHRAG